MVRAFTVGCLLASANFASSREPKLSAPDFGLDGSRKARQTS